MKAIFADTFYWIALTNKLDAVHEQALAISRSLGSSRIVTTEQVITEYLKFFGEWGERFRRKATGNVRGILTLPAITVVPHTHESFPAGLALYAYDSTSLSHGLLLWASFVFGQTPGYSRIR
ncbi:MAG TPA: type II toxin-antitoxin system VapC family toxin [Bryobacteraceae bacterium]|nr:type II toxin-antitoxin system VapC family toxin [Bryobacteraceae bacterium]